MEEDRKQTLDKKIDIRHQTLDKKADNRHWTLDTG